MRTSVLRAALVAAVTLCGTTALTALPAYAAGTSYSWIGSAQSSGGDNHSWTDPKNWSPSGVPGTGDSVAIDAPDATHCTAHVDGVPALTLANLSLSATGCSSTLVGGPLTVTGTFTWNGGTLQADTTLLGTGTVSGSNAHLNVLSANLSVGGTLTLSGVVDSGASNQGGLRIVNPEQLHVLAGGTLSSVGGNAVQFLSCCLNPARIVNDGTIQVSGGDLTVRAVAIDQNGTLSTAAGADLVDVGAPATAAGGASYTGGGAWRVVNGAKLALTGTQHLGAGFRLQLGDGLSGAELGGTATVTGPGVLDWAGGTIEGNLTVDHGTTLRAVGAVPGNGKRFLSGDDGLSGHVPATLTNHGTTTFSQGAGVLTGFGARFVNASDGELDLDPGTVVATLGCCVNPNKVVNAGGHVVVGSGTTTDPAVLSGVAYQATGGSTTIASGRVLQLDLAPSSLNATTVTGGGTLQVDAPTAVSGTSTVGAATTVAVVPTGSLDGAATLTGAGRTTWTGGSLSGTLTLATAGGVRVSGPDPKYVANVGGGSVPSNVVVRAPLSLAAGTATHHDLIDVGQSTLTLAGTTTLADLTELDNGQVRNTGHLTVAAGSTGHVLRGNGVLASTGTVSLSSGTLSALLTMTGGSLDGTGTLSGTLTNTAGTVRPAGGATGTLHVTGTYQQGSSGILALDLSAHGHDVLAVTGSTRVQGSVRPRNLSGYHPSVGARVTVVRAGSLTAAPSCVRTSGSTTGHWVPTHTGTALTLVWRAGRSSGC
ncbi:hypothetical protein GCM10028801_25640 [Nocardioides maradonensis]